MALADSSPALTQDTLSWRPRTWSFSRSFSHSCGACLKPFWPDTSSSVMISRIPDCRITD
eukprot:9933666-Alexandrium_andersonii.AAC.1